LHGGGHIANSGAAATLTVIGGSFNGIIGGPLSVSVTGGSAVTLSGNNTYTGTTTIGGGAILQLGAGGTTGSVAGAIVDNSELAIARSDSFVVNNVSGTGQLRQLGPGVTTLGTGLSYSGGTLIIGGTLVVNDPTALGTGALTINGGELLAGASETISNDLTMSGNFTVAAAHGQNFAITTGNWTLNASPGEVITFGASGQDGTIFFEGNMATVNNASTYTVVVQAGTLRSGN